jgi:hypothetical protein
MLFNAAFGSCRAEQAADHDVGSGAFRLAICWTQAVAW